MKNYDNEAKKLWGETQAYREYENKNKEYTDTEKQKAIDGLNAIFADFADYKACGNAADSADAQALTARLQTHITESFYTCTTEILAGLGKMYTCDERFRENIDRFGQGTAEFVSAAIETYCK